MATLLKFVLDMKTINKLVYNTACYMLGHLNTEKTAWSTDSLNLGVSHELESKSNFYFFGAVFRGSLKNGRTGFTSECYFSRKAMQLFFKIPQIRPIVCKCRKVFFYPGLSQQCGRRGGARGWVIGDKLTIYVPWRQNGAGSWKLKNVCKMDTVSVFQQLISPVS